MNAPANATHTADFYGRPLFYRKSSVKHLNQVSEEWQTRTEWGYWDETRAAWAPVEAGFSSWRLKELACP